MCTYDYPTLCREIATMRTWQIVALSAVCAEKVTPIPRYLALPDTWETAKKALELAWSAITERDCHIEAAQRLMSGLEAAPEWSCEEPDCMPYVVASSLNFFQWALQAVVADPSPEKGERVGLSHMLTTADFFDSATEHPKFDFEKSEIRLAEQSSQQSLVELLKEQEAPTDELVHSLRNEARSVFALFEKALPAACFDFVGDLIAIASQQSP